MREFQGEVITLRERDKQEENERVSGRGNQTEKERERGEREISRIHTLSHILIYTDI